MDTTGALEKLKPETVKVVTLRGWDHRWGGVWQETVAFSYKEVLWHYFVLFDGQRCLADPSSCSHKESDTTEVICTQHTSYILNMSWFDLVCLLWFVHPDF